MNILDSRHVSEHLGKLQLDEGAARLNETRLATEAVQALMQSGLIVGVEALRLVTDTLRHQNYAAAGRSGTEYWTAADDLAAAEYEEALAAQQEEAMPETAAEA